MRASGEQVHFYPVKAVGRGGVGGGGGGGGRCLCGNNLLYRTVCLIYWDSLALGTLHLCVSECMCVFSKSHEEHAPVCTGPLLCPATMCRNTEHLSVEETACTHEQLVYYKYNKT